MYLHRSSSGAAPALDFMGKVETASRAFWVGRFFFLGRFAIRVLLTYGFLVVQAKRYDGDSITCEHRPIRWVACRLGIRVALGGSTLTPVSVYLRSSLRG